MSQASSAGHFDKGKPDERRDRVLMLDARNIALFCRVRRIAALADDFVRNFFMGGGLHFSTHGGCRTAVAPLSDKHDSVLQRP